MRVIATAVETTTGIARVAVAGVAAALAPESHTTDGG